MLPILWMTDGHSGNTIVPGNTSDPPCKFYYNSTLKKKVYTQYEVEPAYTGGAAAYQRFLNKHLRYPQQEIDNDLQSTVNMQFIVNSDGRIINPGISNKSDTADYTPLEKEALRVLKLMPNWTPATCQGKKVTAEVRKSMVVCYSTE